MFVGNIAWGLSWQDLKEVFSEYGEVTYAKIIQDRETWKSKWFGFIEFASVEDAQNAKDAMDWKELEGRELKVDFAQDKRDA